METHGNDWNFRPRILFSESHLVIKVIVPVSYCWRDTLKHVSEVYKSWTGVHHPTHQRTLRHIYLTFWCYDDYEGCLDELMEEYPEASATNREDLERKEGEEMEKEENHTKEEK